MLVLESTLWWILLGGVVIVLIAYLWLILRAFRTHRAWGWFSLLIPGLGPLVFSIFRWSRARPPILLFLVGSLAVGTAYGINQYQINFPDLSERKKIVEGQLHLTLTGWDRHNYAILEQYPNAVVVQMANDDVTDEDLKYLQGMKSLEELDLNDTKVTDAGLVQLDDLPLKRLRLRGTGITEEGFKQHLVNKKTLKELDLRKTNVSSATLRQWKAAEEGRNFLR